MTQGLERALSRMISTLGERARTIISMENDPSLYKSYFTIDISNPNDIMCPLFCINHIRKVLDNEINQEEHINKIAIPLQLDPDYRDFKTIDSALRYIFESNSSLSFEKVEIKNEVFYGGKNLILADDLLPLFMVCARYDAIAREIKEIIIVVDQELLINTNSVIGKAIMKKLVPHYLGRTLRYDPDAVINSGFSGQPSALFTQIKNMITTNRIGNEPYTLLESNLQTLVNSIDYVA